MHSPEPSHRGTATAGEQLSRHLHTQAADFLRSLRLHSESGADTVAAAEAARALRASSRRIGGTLATFRPLLDPSWADGLRTELTWLSTVLAQEHACTARLLRLMDALSRLSGTSPVPPARTELRPLGADAGTSAARRSPAGSGAGTGPQAGGGDATAVHPAAAGTAPGDGAVDRPAPAPGPAGRATAGPVPAHAQATTPAGLGPARGGPRTGPGPGTGTPREATPATGGAAPADGGPAGTVGAQDGSPVPPATGNPRSSDASTGPAMGLGPTSPATADPASTGEGPASPGRTPGTPTTGNPPATGAAPTAPGTGPAPRAGGARGALAVGAARAGALLERRLTLARTRAHSAALGALGSARFHAVADAVALLASDLPLAPAAAGPADETLPLLADLAERRLLDAVARLPLSRAAHPYNAEALGGGLAPEPDDARQDAPWHEVRRLLRLHRYAQEAARPGAAPVLVRAALLLDHHRDAAEAAEAAAAAARTPRIAPATAYALGVLHADQRHEVEAARFAFQQEWRHTTTAVPAP
ncbi:CHAD domain-containing protein [Streptomyces sp. NPDC005805]|uniref:CHAD domain-containing protein n=1 Tax=Streptomyces sp. NPDC005805 TaxID=3157068 RepID=UPI0033C88C70